MDLSALKALHFIHPYWLLMLPLLWAVIIWFAWRRRRDGGWSQVIDAELLPALRLHSGDRGSSPWWLISVVWTVAVLALASPAWQRGQTPAYHAPADWIVVLDLSPSMAASDVQPSRVARARYVVADLLNAAQDARVGLLVFAGEAHVVAPLTTDVATVRALLSPLAPSIMPESGDVLAPALQESSRLIGSTASRHAHVIVISDGFVDPSQALRQAQQLRQQGATLDVIGIGTTNGAPVPNTKGGFEHDAQDETELSKLSVDQLQRVAVAGGGQYFDVNQLGSLIAQLRAARSYDLDQLQAQPALQVNTWLNGGFWLLLPLLLLVPLLARRGWL